MSSGGYSYWNCSIPASRAIGERSKPDDRWLLVIEYARLRPGPGFAPVQALLYYVQRLATPYWLRAGLSRVIARFLAARHPSLVSSDAGRSGLAGDLRSNGLVSLPSLVTPEWADKVLAYLQGKEVVVQGRAVPLDRVSPEVTIADYSLITVLSCPLIMALINDPEVLSLASAYLGCCPTLSSVGLRWSFPSRSRASDVQRFHRDPDDWRFVKLFVYLTEVDENSGPHVYVQGSHRTDVELRARSYDLARIEKAFGPDAVQTVTGPRGTAFMADTAGIHMGRPPSDRPRLMLVAQYSLLPVFAFKYHPLDLRPRPAVDPYVNRLLIA